MGKIVLKRCRLRIQKILNPVFALGALFLIAADAQAAGTLVVKSSPSDAKIYYKYGTAPEWANTNLTTPQTFSGLPEGDYRIRLEKSGYAIWESTVQTLTTGATLTIAPSLTPAGTVTVNSTPKGAEIWFKYNSSPTWNSSGFLTDYSTNTAPVGDYQFRLTKSGYAAWESSTATLKTDAPITLSPTLSPAANVKLTSSPSGATLWVFDLSSNEFKETPFTTPYTFVDALAAGTYRIQLRKSGYAPAEKEITLLVGSNADINISLSPAANVTLNSIPSGAVIWLYDDNTDQFVESPFTTPHKIVDAIPPGTYRYQLKKPAYVIYEGTATLVAGPNDDISPTLIPSATLTLTSNPAGARIHYMYLSGGDTDWVDSGYYTPQTFSDIPSGNYAIRLTSTGFSDWTTEFVLNAGETKTVNGNFSAPASIQINSTPPGAEIWASFDGKIWGNTGKKTNHEFLEVATGTYHVKLLKPGYAAWETVRVLSAGANSAINANLVPTSAPISPFRVWEGKIKIGGTWYKSDLTYLQSKPGNRTPIDKTLALTFRPTTPNGSALLLITGGRNGSTNASFTDPQTVVFFDNKRLLDNGWTLVSAEYRGSLTPPDMSFFDPPLPAYGDLIPQYDTFEGAEWAHGEEDDVVSIAEWMKGGGHGFVPSKLCVVGGSHGGYLNIAVAHRVTGVTRSIVMMGGADGVGMANYQKNAPTVEHPDFPGESPVSIFSQADRTAWIQRMYEQAGGETEWSTKNPGRKWFDSPPLSSNMLVLSNVDDAIAPPFLQSDYAERWSATYPSLRFYQFTAKENPACTYANAHGCVALSVPSLEDYLNNGTFPASYAGPVLSDSLGKLLDAKTNEPIAGAKVTFFNRFSGISKSERTGISASDGKVSVTNIHGGYTTVRIEAVGYETQEGDVYLRRGTNDFTGSPILLSPLAKGNISVTSSPPGARISYSWNGGDWVHLDAVTNFTFADAPAGSYRVRLLKPGYEEWISSPQTSLGGDSLVFHANLSPLSAPQLRYFGFYQNIDVRPTLSSEMTSLPWVNVLAVGEKETETKILEAAAHGKKALVPLMNIFFKIADTPDPARTFPLNIDAVLRTDFEDQWRAFVKKHNLKSHTDKIAAFYLADEPYWNNITYEELVRAAVVIKRDFPTTPVALVEAYTVMDGMNGSEFRVPEMVDWVGFDKYAVPHPLTDKTISANFATLKSKMTQPRQRIVLVGDAFFENTLHGASGMKVEDMAHVFNEQVALFKKDPRVIGIVNFTWDSWGDDYSDSWITAREFSPEILGGYQAVGQRVVSNTPGDILPPSVVLTSPSDGSVYGNGTSLTLSASATDNVAPVGVEFYMDGRYLGLDTSAPYQWTVTPSSGTHVLEALAYDAAGNSRLSPGVWVNITNMKGDLVVLSTPSGAKITYSLNGGAWIDPSFVTPHTFSAMEAGSYRIRLTKDGYTPWEETKILSPGETVTFNAVLSPTPGTLVIQSSPSGALIAYSFNNGSWVNPSKNTPHTLTDMPPGEYRVRLSKSGYTDWEETQTLLPGATLVFNAVLSNTFATLIVNSTPSGARIHMSFDDGPWTDTTFDTNFIFTNLSPGKYKLRLVKDGYALWEDTRTLAAGDAQTITAVLSDLPGTVEVNSTPAGARVFLSYNGGAWEDTGLDTKQIFTNRPPGEYRVRLTKLGYADWEETQTLTAGGGVIFNAALSSAFGSLTVNSTPKGARIWWSHDGGPWVDTGFDTDHIFSNIATGEYRVRLALDGYTLWEDVRTLHAGDNTVLNAALTPSAGTVEVLSTPAGARIFLSYNSGSSEDTGFDTDHTFTGKPAGTYRVRLKKDGFADWEQTQILPTGGTLHFSAVLTPTLGTVTVKSTPPGARIYLSYNSGNWEDTGFDTDHTFTDKPSGLYRVRLEKDGYAPWEQVQILSSGGSVEFNADLAAGAGTLVVESSPMGARIHMSYNGGAWEDTGFDTNHTFTGKPAGLYRVRLKKDGYADWEQTKTLSTGGALTFKTALTPSTGKITVNSTPAGAHIKLSYNGGEWMDEGAVTPFTFENRPAGVYRVLLTKENHLSWEKSDILATGAHLTFDASLTSTLGSLHVTSIPPGARLLYTHDGGDWIDPGKFTDTTLTDLPPGNYQLKLEKDGYAEWRGEVSLQGGFTVSAQAILRPSLAVDVSALTFYVDVPLGGTAGDLRQEGLSVAVPPESLPDTKTMKVLIAPRVESSPPTHQGIQEKMPGGTTLRSLFEVLPLTSAESFFRSPPKSLTAPMGLTLAHDIQDDQLPSLWRWEDAQNLWRSVEGLSAQSAGTEYKTSEARLGLYAVLTAPAPTGGPKTVMFPQPALGNAVTLRLLTGGGDTVQLSLFDTLGQRVLNQSLRTTSVVVGNQAVKDVRVDVSGLSSGIYWYVVESNGGKSSGKMAVVK